MKIQWMRYKSYSGAKIRGTAPVLPPEGADRASHMQRAFYLTAMLESPTWGSVQSYDGAGMSGGPLHNIAVHPHAKGRPQGSLWGLVRDIEKSSGALVEPLYEWLGEFGWYVASDAKVRQLDTGVLVPGEELRIALSGSGGKTPKAGPIWERAKHAARLFHQMLSAPGTRPAQRMFAIEYLVKTQALLERSVYEGMTGRHLRTPERLTTSDLSDEQDLAMCIYHSHSVNGPAPARTALKAALAKAPARTDQFPATLVRLLGTSRYGRWHDEPGEKNNRYDRTRGAARKSGLWDARHFAKGGIMPVDLTRRGALNNRT